jgi:dihydrolipoamide dehydrogenase
MVTQGPEPLGEDDATVFFGWALHVGTRFEIATGSEVTVIEMLDRLVPVEDAEVSAELAKAFRRFGIKAHTGTALQKAEVQANGEIRIEAKATSGGDGLELVADVLLVAVGRKPVTDGIGLQALGIQTERGQIPVDSYQRTVVDTVYAAGDIVPGPQLAHKASAEAMVAVEHLAGRSPRPIEHRLVPGATYCEPEIGSVGLTEEQAREQGYDVKLGKFPFAALGRAVLEGATYGFVKIVAEKRYDEVLGVHIIGPKATELIAEACTALNLEATSEALGQVIRAHPTLAEAMGEAAHDVNGSPIHL